MSRFNIPSNTYALRRLLVTSLLCGACFSPLRAAQLVGSTYLGGDQREQVNGIAIGPDGSAYITGNTKSTNFPVTAGTFQTNKMDLYGENDAYVARMTPFATGLVFSTFLAGDDGAYTRKIAVDTAGYVYVVGETESTNFPTLNAFQSEKGDVSAYDAFATKFTPDGTGIVFSTYLGGKGYESCWGLGVDGSGYVYVAGYTTSNFPTTVGAFQTTNSGGNDIFVTKLHPDGTGAVYSTLIGGHSNDYCHNLAIDSAGCAYVAGYTKSTDFPATPGAFQTTNAGGSDIVVVKLAPDGASLAYATYIGGAQTDDAFGLAVDSNNVAYLSGYTRSTNFPTFSPVQTGFMGDADVCVLALDENGGQLVFSTFLGGNDFERSEALVRDTNGSIYITGYTDSTNYPVTSAAYHPTNPSGTIANSAFMTKLHPSGTSLTYSTYFGGEGADRGHAIGVGRDSSIYVAGEVSSTNLPVTVDAFQTNIPGMLFRASAFVTRMPPYPVLAHINDATVETNGTTIMAWQASPGWSITLQYTSDLLGTNWVGVPGYSNVSYGVPVSWTGALMGVDGLHVFRLFAE